MKSEDYKKEMEEIIDLRKQGFKLDEISEITGIPRGTISCRLSRMGLAKECKKKAVTVAEKPETVEVREKTLSDFKPREMIKHLYNLGYRIKDNELYVITLQKVNINSVINE